MLNPDGVFLGNQRSDLLGSDPNRCWNRATTYAHPALVAVKDQLTKLSSEKVITILSLDTNVVSFSHVGETFSLGYTILLE